MRDFRRYPYRPLRRNYPCAIRRSHRHNPTRGEDQLVYIVKMQWDYVPGGIIAGERPDFGMSVPQPLENRALASLRH
jgi:hypothetical protein